MPSATSEFLARGVLAWLKHRPFSREARERRKAKRRARREAKRNGQALPVETDEVPMLQGKKTYLGIVTAAVGVVLTWVGVGEADSATLSAQLVGALDQLLTVGGLLFAAYGRAKAKPAA